VLKKTTLVMKKTQIIPKWYLIDVKDKVLGRAATKIARLLLGKDKPTLSDNLPVGDFVIVTNSKAVGVSGRKEEDKNYYNYSGYPSGLRVRTLRVVRKTKPEEVIRHAVWGMMPKTKLGKELMARLHIYPGIEHSHEAQKPEKVAV